MDGPGPPNLRSSVVSMKRVMPVVVLLVVGATPATAAEHPRPMGEYALSIVQKLTSEPRVQGTAGERRAGATIRSWFDSYGLETRVQKFTYTRKGIEYTSRNIIATLPGRTSRTVIIGAHYDNRPEGAGADDNASGVSVMLEVAKRAAKRDPLPYTLTFVAFGAEENPGGLVGSNRFVQRMSKTQIRRTEVMINYDSLIVGDHLYVHAGANGRTGPRDAMLGVAARHLLPLQIQPGWNPAYPAGITPNGFSDYTAFNKAGIPIVAFEATNWEIGDFDGYTQTEEHGSYWHTPSDTLPTILADYPQRPGAHLYVFTKGTVEYLNSLR